MSQEIAVAAFKFALQVGTAVLIQSLTPGPRLQRSTGRLGDINVLSSSEGASIPKIYGRARVGGEVIWRTRFLETVTTTTERQGGKGGGGGARVETTTYTYTCSFAVALCEGVIGRVNRVWADGNLIDLADATIRVYRGTEDQLPDPLIQAIEGAEDVSAYRGVAYIVFEDFEVTNFGRIPQLSFEVVAPVRDNDPEALNNIVRGVDLIPGSGEFSLATDVVFNSRGDEADEAENRHNLTGTSDLVSSMDDLEALLPNVETVVLVVSWFGTDLRCGECEIIPGVEVADKETYDLQWSVDGISRGSAYVVSQTDGRPTYGGTPSDESVRQAIAELKSRGYRVVFYPFVLMDVPPTNALPDPYTPGGTQPAFPWRGRITCDPAPGVAGSVDKTAAAGSQVDTFFERSNGYARFVNHYADLCAEAGGVDAFLVGTELRALTTVRSSASAYPAVAQLRALAASVKSRLPGVLVSYAADWSEYFGHQPVDGTGDVYFHLDPFWSDANVDFIGIDNYWPLSDWRDGDGHADALAGVSSIYDLDYLRTNVRGGEGFDWFYASDADRDAQVRTSITDGQGKPWVFKYKDVRSWWENQHYDRPGGVEQASPTSWVPQSKPFWFTEVGCPAVDKGSNQPNVFVDPKSSESDVPHYSSGLPDPLIQRRYVEAFHLFWNDGSNNPTSTQYAGQMVDLANIHVWTWDCRPFPDFPTRGDVWADGSNWRLGHWLNGRAGLIPLDILVEALTEDIPQLAARVEASSLQGLVTGLVVDADRSPRDDLDALGSLYFFDGTETQGKIVFRHRDAAAVSSLTVDDLVIAQDRVPLDRRRTQETELPVQVSLTAIDDLAGYRQVSAPSRKLTGQSQTVVSESLPIVMPEAELSARADVALQEAWARRESLSFVLPPSRLALDPGDVVFVSDGDAVRRVQLTSATDAASRSFESVSSEPSIYAVTPGLADFRIPVPSKPPGRPVASFLDLPLLSADAVPHAPYFAAGAGRWPGGGVLLYRGVTEESLTLDVSVPLPSPIGSTLSALPAAPDRAGRWDRGAELIVKFVYGGASSLPELAVLSGENVIAVETDAGFEVIQYAEAEFLGNSTYRLSTLLRGQRGTEGDQGSGILTGARVVGLGGALRQPGLDLSQRSASFVYRYGPALKPIGDVSWQTETRAFEGRGLRPFAPVHLKGARDASGWSLSWIRRTRLPESEGDGWSAADVPLGEQAESYEVDIMDGGSVVRTLTSTTSSVTYAAADEGADFGGAQSSLTIRVYQISAEFGRGVRAEATV